MSTHKVFSLRNKYKYFSDTHLIWSYGLSLEEEVLRIIFDRA